jgi:hypothetical protein
MTLGKWISWRPLNNMTNAYYDIKYYHASFQELKIILAQPDVEKKTEIHVTFFSGEEIFRIKRELYYTALWLYLSQTYKADDLTGPLFIVEDSAYLKQLSEESEHLIDAFYFKHYFIMDEDWSFDIASQQQPQVELFINDVLIEVSACQWHKKKTFEK